MIAIPNLWTKPHGSFHRERLRIEAAQASRSHALPLSPEAWRERVAQLRAALGERLHLCRSRQPLEPEFHGEIRQNGYTIRKISFFSAPEIRVTGNLYIPDGAGPFPAVLNLHGHWRQGKLAARIQARGHVLAQNGIAMLAVDGAGAGERGRLERLWEYHGSTKAGELFLRGDSLLAMQVRDNQRALDLLQSLPLIDPERIGATGASGGGNQVTWLSALDPRVKVAVPVASAGSFEAYVTRRNCVCETLPGGLALGEQWHLFGAIAPRPLLILNALHDQPAFGPEALEFTSRHVREIYSMLDADEQYESRLLDMQHGFHPPALQAMLGWMKHWLCGSATTSPQALPVWADLPEEVLICYPEGERPASCNYEANRETLELPPLADAGEQEALAVLTGWRKPPEDGSELAVKKVFADGSLACGLLSPRQIPMPLFFSGEPAGWTGEIRLLLSPEGKRGAFVSAQWRETLDAGALAVAADLPAVGELAWDIEPMERCAFHDEARACLWLGYTLAGEWAEAVATLCATLHCAAPGATLRIVAEGETAFAALLSLALEPREYASVEEHQCPASLRGEKRESLVWHIPGFLRWGDLDTLRALAGGRNRPHATAG